MERDTAPQVLFVCTQNTNRSPAAEIIMGQRAPKVGLRLSISSAGIETPERQQMSSKMKLALNALGYVTPYTKYTRGLTEEDLRQADLVLTFEDWHRVWIYQNHPVACPKLYTLNEYSGYRGEIVDPVRRWRTTESRQANSLPKFIRHPLGIYLPDTEQDDLLRNIYVPGAKQIDRAVERCLIKIAGDPRLSRCLA